MMPVNARILIPALLISLFVWQALLFADLPHAIAATAAITLFTAVLWVTEALPIPATSLIPFFAFPMAGVISHKEAASSLGSHVILLLMGAFMLSKALEKSNVHHRLAVGMLKLIGTGSAKKLVTAFMLTAAILSMWISNTATALMLLPIALAILQHINAAHRLVTALLLGIAYAASLGGVGTPIGTPPNIIFVSVYAEFTGIDMNFLTWMKTGVPIVLIAIPLMALWLTRGLGRLPDYDLPAVGDWRAAEKRVLMVFLLVAMAWVFRPYWSQLLNMPLVSDSTIAIFGVVLMFVIPSGQGKCRNEQAGKETDTIKNNVKKPKIENGVDTLLDWKTACDIPWGMLLLFAGGICLAKGFAASGLSQILGNSLTGLAVLPLPLLILGICLFVTFLTEITSNTATATLLMPILASAAEGVGVKPEILMIPAAISASCAFMLPVATAPNAIVYGTNQFSIRTMAKEGSVLNVIVALVVAAVVYVSVG